MKISNPNALLYIHPAKEGADEPIIDNLTKKILWAVRNQIAQGVLFENGKFVIDLSTKGHHHCTGCNKKCPMSRAQDILLPNKIVTNTLAVHYVAQHRDELTKEELAQIESIEVDDATLNSLSDPTQEELGIWMNKCYWHSY